MTTVKALMSIRDAYTGKTHEAGEVWDYAGYSQQIEGLVAMGAIEIVKPQAAAVQAAPAPEIKSKRGSKHG